MMGVKHQWAYMAGVYGGTTGPGASFGELRAWFVGFGLACRRAAHGDR